MEAMLQRIAANRVACSRKSHVLIQVIEGAVRASFCILFVTDAGVIAGSTSPACPGPQQLITSNNSIQ